MMQQHQEGISTTGTSSTKQAGAARGSRVMDNRLRPWALYDLSGAPTADTLDTMKDHFRRFRGLRQKGVEGTAGCRSRGLVYREEIIKDHSLSELRGRVCSDAWEDMRRVCYVRVAEGCESCAGPRPTVEEWKAHIAEYLGEQERGWFGKYKHWLAENARASSRGGSNRHSSRVAVLARVRTHRVLIRGVIRRYKLELVPLDHIRDVAKEVGARLPRIFLRREAEPMYLITTHVWDIVSEVTMTSGDARRIAVGNNAFNDPADISSSVNNRRGTVTPELDEALDQAARAAGETAQLRQSNREILARLRMLERSVHGQLRTGTQPRDPAPGTGGLMARRSRREGRPTHAPAQETELTLES
ncbi:hypothetical protein PC122_g10982 [Phytophthora cactorum]|nr:hypothetical protein PC122_g10982 [Phytophthora cactorum]